MLKHADCFFCKEVENPNLNILSKNRKVFETENFVVFPTVGCFVIGYLLIMPKQHFLSFGDLDAMMIEELNGIVKRISKFNKQNYGKECIIFEHGTKDLTKLTSTSIMHAHIHIIPFENNIIKFLPNGCELKKIGGFEDLKYEQDNYLYIRDIYKNDYIVKNAGYPSQFFRKVACECIGIPDCWEWQKYDFKENMEKTLNYYNKI